MNQIEKEIQIQRLNFVKQFRKPNWNLWRSLG